MGFSAVLLLAILYAGAVFCVCSFQRIKTGIANLFSKKNIKFLRGRTTEPPIDGLFVDEGVKNAVEPILLAWRDADETALPDRMDKTFLERMQRIIKVLKKYGIRRELKLRGTVSVRGDNGKAGFRKWNEGGREWREGELTSALLDCYSDARSGEPVQDHYYPEVRISVLQSRHIRYEDAKKETQSRKDKFGYMKKKTQETVFYGEHKNIVCDSCGAALEINTQLVTCPYCGSRLFSEFHDWQTEHFSVEPVTQAPLSRAAVCAGFGFVSSLLVHLVDSLLLKHTQVSVLPTLLVVALTVAAAASYRFVLRRAEEKRKKQIVRFSIHQFRQCMYEELWNRFKTLDIVDFFIGDIKVRAVKNTEETTELTVSAPLFTQTVKDGGVVFEKTNWKGVFTRARYPERLKSKGAVVEERECPSCGGNFMPDAHGCCAFCGYSLKVSNAKWKLKQTL